MVEEVVVKEQKNDRKEVQEEETLAQREREGRGYNFGTIWHDLPGFRTIFGKLDEKQKSGKE